MSLGRTNATEECQRLDLQHEIWKYASDGQLVWAPVDLEQIPLRIVDSAGANGTWLLDVTKNRSAAIDHPESSFICGDIDSLKFPPVTENNRHLEFLEQSYTQPWPDRLHGSFDLVHQRLAISASGRVPPLEIIGYFSALLKPGKGWLQLVEYDVGPDPAAAAGDPMEDFKRLLNAVTMSIGSPQYYSRQLARDMRSAGLVDVHESSFDVYYGKAFRGKAELVEPSIRGPVSFSARFCKLASEREVDVATEVVADLPDRLDRHLRERGGHVNAVAVCGRRPRVES